jgi:probable F420-dependent oxidoreductase
LLAALGKRGKRILSRKSGRRHSRVDRGQAKEVVDAIGRVGVWSFALDAIPMSSARAFVAEIEALGYRALWIPESIGGKEIFSHAAVLLSAGRDIVVASGIANIWARDPMAMESGSRNLADAFPGRFVLAMGVSHADSVDVRGGRYRRPYSKMRDYLDVMERVRYDGPQTPRAPRLLAALGPRMLALAAERTLGAHPYFVPVEHTAFARERLGKGPLLAVEQTAVLRTDAAGAREIARAFAVDYLELPNYATNLLRLGYGEDELNGGGSDRLIDAVVAWGDEEALGRRVQEHLDAGADHVCLQMIGGDPSDRRLDDLRRLAPLLLTATGAA